MPSSNETLLDLVIAEGAISQPTPISTFSSPLINQSSSTTTAWDTCTNTLLDTSSYSQGTPELDGFYPMPNPVSGVSNFRTCFAATDSSGSAAEDMLDDMATLPYHDATTDTFGNNLMAAQPLNSIDEKMMNDVARNLFGMGPQISDYTAPNTYGYTPMNSPLNMPMNTLGLTALPQPEFAPMNLLADIGSESSNGRVGCSTDNMTEYPFKQGTIGAVDSPTLGAYYTATPDSLAQNTYNWYLENGMQHSLYDPGKCRGPFHGVRLTCGVPNTESMAGLNDLSWAHNPVDWWSCQLENDEIDWEAM